jgi:hypothetical protein
MTDPRNENDNSLTKEPRRQGQSNTLHGQENPTKDELVPDEMIVLALRAFLFLVGAVFLIGGLFLVYYPPAPYLDVFGGIFVLVSPYWVWLSLFAPDKLVLKHGFELIDRLF